MNQRRRHDDELARNVEIQRLQQPDRVEVLRRDERNRNVVNTHLVLFDEVQQEIERSLEVVELDRECVEGGFEALGLVHQDFYLYEIFIASRTRAIVSVATRRARLEPSNRTSFKRSGFASTAARRSRIGSRCAFNALASLVFTSTSPT